MLENFPASGSCPVYYIKDRHWELSFSDVTNAGWISVIFLVETACL